jgi:hypothetical protein
MRGEAMELPGSNYLYTIATLSITYAGFAALIVIFRQIIGGGVSSYDLFIIRSVLMRSFIIAFSAMLPPALALFDLSQSVIWRISSLFAAVLLGLFTLTFPARRRAATDRPITKWLYIIIGAQTLITIFLLMMVLGILVEPAAGPFVIAITAILIAAAVAYLAQLDVMLRGYVEKKKRK